MQLKLHLSAIERLVFPSVAGSSCAACASAGARPLCAGRLREAAHGSPGQRSRARPWHEHRRSVCVPRRERRDSSQGCCGFSSRGADIGYTGCCCGRQPRPAAPGEPCRGAGPRCGAGSGAAAPAAAAPASLAQRILQCLGTEPAA